SEEGLFVIYYRAHIRTHLYITVSGYILLYHYSLYVVHLLKCFHSSLVCYSVVFPAEAYFPVSRIIYMPPVPSGPYCVYMVYFSRPSTYRTPLIFYAGIEISSYIICPLY